MLTKMRYLLFGMLIAVLLLTGAAALAEDSDFVIENGILTKYNGTDTEVVVPNGVTEIGSHAFYNNTSIVRVVLPDGLKCIGLGAFSGCSSLGDINMPDSVTDIGNLAFNGCSSLYSISLSDDVTIGNYFVQDPTCVYLNIESNTARSLAQSGYYGSVYDLDSPDLRLCAYTNVNNECRFDVVEYSGTAGKVIVPNGVTGIDMSAFAECSSITEIQLPDTLTDIEEYAFFGCTSLKEINIPDSVVTISYGAFVDCCELTSITIPENVTVIDDSMFSGCSSLKNISLPDGIVSIGNDAFAGCSSIADIFIPDSVRSIGDSAFANCKMLTNISIPDGVISLGFGVFSGCYSLAKIDLPQTLKIIGEWAFVGCANLRYIDIPDSVITIGDDAFYNCWEMKQLTLPSSLTSLDETISDTPTSVVLHRNIVYLPPQAFGSLLETVYCYRNTYAADWAEDNGYTIIYLDDNQLQDITEITCTVTEKYIDVGRTYNCLPEILITPVLPEQTYTLQLSSSNTSVAKVNGTEIEIVSTGRATITVSIKEMPGVTCSFTAIGCTPVEDFSLPAMMVFSADECKDAYIMPDNIKPAGIEACFRWIPSYDGEMVYELMQEGTRYDLAGNHSSSITLTAISQSGIVRTCQVYTYSRITNLRVNGDMTLFVGHSFKPEVITFLDGVATENIPTLYTLSSSEPSVVSVGSDGWLHGEKAGSAIITVMSRDGQLSKTFTVTVSQFSGTPLPASLTIIEEEAFMGSSLTGIIIPDGCTSIGSRAFANCTALAAVKIPASVTEIAADAFEGSSPIICTSQGSAAHTFAVEHSLPLSLP